MSEEDQTQLLDSETRFIYAHAQSGEVFYQAWGETTYIPVPQAGDRIRLQSSTATLDEDDGNWDLEQGDRITMLVKDIEYTYNYVSFKNNEGDPNAVRLLADVWIYGEPIEEIETES